MKQDTIITIKRGKHGVRNKIPQRAIDEMSERVLTIFFVEMVDKLNKLEKEALKKGKKE